MQRGRKPVLYWMSGWDHDSLVHKATGDVLGRIVKDEHTDVWRVQSPCRLATPLTRMGARRTAEALVAQTAAAAS
jgi:hypothetical protein